MTQDELDQAIKELQEVQYDPHIDHEKIHQDIMFRILSERTQ